MAEILSPGVFIEEVPSQVQVIQAVSTSNLGAVGFTQKGPTDVATLVTSFENFSRTFGPIVAESFLPLSMAAYFSNGGKRAFIVRVVPSDAVSADALIDSQQTDQGIETGDGIATTFSKTALTTTLNVNSGASPIVAGSFTVSWRGPGTPVAAEAIRNRADDADVILDVGGTAFYEGRINPASLPTFDAEHFAVVPGTFTLNYDPDGASAATLAVPATTAIATATNVAAGNGATVTIDHRTGYFSVEFEGTAVPGAGATGFTVDYTPATSTLSVTDDGTAGPTGNLPAGTELSGAGDLDLDTGAYSFDALTAPHDEAPIIATYQINAWDLNPVSAGTWANDMRTTVEGDLDFYDAATNSYSRHRFNVLLLNASTGNYDIVETYEQLSFSDSADAQYFPDVVNELSDYVTVEEPGGDEAPRQLDGIARSEVIGGGDESAGGQAFEGTTAVTPNHVPVATRTVVITYTDTTGAVQTITDDGAGNLVGSVDGAGTNTINYTTGVMEFTTLNAINATTLVSLAYREAAAETLHTESFAGGSNGTFSAGTYGRNQFTSSALLEADTRGMYALNRIEELMQIMIPDFVGDVTITGDILDYVDGRALQPSGGDRFALLQPPVGSSAQEAVDWFRFDLGRFSKFAALYWPHVRVADPLADNRPKTMPVLGHVAGIYARTDTSKNVGKAPGGTVDGALRFLTGLEFNPTQGERDYVYPNKINPLISSPQTGLAVWGVRTIAQESEWRYINVRRLFMFLEKSVFNATHWIVFENNGPALWAKIKAQLQGFLNNQFNEGLFAGNSPSEAFFVIVDESNNDASSIAAGQVIIDIGVAANTPAEFVRFRFQQITLG
jgi:phage tail sheath protein FI